ncbi:hypothetical protein ACFL2V_14215 [Pseudomonadota bacterium]
MNNTLVIQSHRSPLPFVWIEHCMASVRHWCEANHYEYRFMGDELFDCVAEPLLRKTEHQRVIATDIARLLVIRDALDQGYQRVVWFDADFLIFSPSTFVLSNAPYLLGRETWVQFDKNNKLKVYKKVHNAFLLFQQGNSFLDFYIETATRLLTQNTGTVPPQFIGPKLLTALHNVASLPVMESAGMLSPLVIKDIVMGKGDALSLFIKHSPCAIAAANLCTSSCEREEVSEGEMERLISILRTKQAISLLG